MDRRSFLRSLAAVPAAYMLSRYGLPEAGTDLDFDAIYQQIYQRQVRWASQELQEAAGPIGWKVYCTVAQLNEMWAPRIGQEGI